MKTKKVQTQNKKDNMKRFLKILLRKEVGELKYILNI